MRTSTAITPNNREIIAAQSDITGKEEYLTSHNGALNVTASITPSGTQDVNLIEVGGVAVALGQTTMSASIPITIASDQSALPVVGSTIGATAPTTAFFTGIKNAAGNLFGQQTIEAGSGIGNNASSDGMLPFANFIYNGNSAATSLDAIRSSTAANNTVGAGVVASGLMAQFDDVTPGTITENNVGKLRMSTNRNLYGTIRDAGGSERGANVNASNQLSVSVDNTTLKVGTTSAAVNVGQQTVNTTAVQLNASATTPTNGIIVRALSTNSASIFVGGSGVTTSTGYELVAGESISFTCVLNTLYIISVASTTDKCCFNVE